MKLALLNFFAGLCMTFNVDWNTELPDDPYCAAYRAAQQAGKASVRPAVLAGGSRRKAG